MAQLGDTTVVGDLSATGKLWGEGNRLYVPDYDALDVSKLNMQVGEIMTVYNDNIDSTITHGPWGNSSAGYLIRNNNVAIGHNNCVFTLMIHRSDASGEFAVRVWQNNKWNNWVIGGSGGSSTPSKPTNIHYWDGKSSTDNSSNLDLWKEAIEEAKSDGYSVVISEPTYTNLKVSGSTFVITKDLTTTSNKTIYSLPSNPMTTSRSSEGIRGFGVHMNSVTLTYTNNVLTSTSKISYSDLSASYLTTESNAGLSGTFIPTQDYHPATKKYVDDNKSDVFYWDGKSSTTNPNNIKVWQDIIDKAKTKTVLIYASDESSTASQKKCIFIINPSDVKSSGTMYLYSIPNYALESSGSGVGGYTQIYKGSTNIVVSSGTVTSVSALASGTTSSYKYLPTNSTTVDSYTPTYDYHPATKKYVDDFEYKGSSNQSVIAHITNGYGFTVTQDDYILVERTKEGYAMDSIDLYIQDPMEPGEYRDKLVIELDFGNTVTPGYYRIEINDSEVYSDEPGGKVITYDESNDYTPTHIYIEYSMVDYDDDFTVKITRPGPESSTDSSVTYLSTNNKNSYTPVHDYNPATKKYVDDKSSKAVQSTDGSNLNWITMTRTEFELAKKNDTIEDGTVINVLDDNEIGIGNFNTFYWDGKSSANNSNNLYLWKNILSAAEDYGCAIVLTENSTNPIIFSITKDSLPSSTTTSKVYYSSYHSANTTNDGSYGIKTINLNRKSVQLSFTSGELTSVGVSTGVVTSDSYLTTNTLTTSYDGKYFTPTKSYQPISKGYLETQIITTQKTSLTCNLPTDLT